MDAHDERAKDVFRAGLTRAAAQAELRRMLLEAGIESPGLDARLLTAAALDVSPTSLLANPDAPMDAAGAARLAELAGRRLAREPVARILGEAEFWGLPFRLSPGTLAPRPDTETIVEAALDAVGAMPQPQRILDLGTGSGCILVALLSERREAFGVGIDRSADALATARGNAHLNGVGDRAAFVASDWAAAIDGRFGLVVSNPPYIRAGEIPSLQPEVSGFDPMAALDGGRDGLDAYRAILSQVGYVLAPAARIVLELGHDQADAVAAIAGGHGFDVVAVRTDLGGHRRAITLAAGEGLVSRG